MEREEGNRDNTQDNRGHSKIVYPKPIEADTLTVSKTKIPEWAKKANK